MRRTLSIMVIVSLASCDAFSQIPRDTAFTAAATEHTLAVYKQALGAQAKLYNGRRYHAPEHSLEQHPYFSSADWLMGAAFYDGAYFTDVPLMYDLNSGALVTEHYPSGNPIQLVSEKLQHFSLGGHYFEKIENGSVSNSLPRSGFYDILYEGETKLIALRQKFQKKEIESSAIEISYDEKNRYFILRNGVFFPLRNKASALKLMAEKKQELRKYAKQHRASFSQDRELLLKSLARHYDMLK